MIHKYYINIARPQTMEDLESLKAVVEPLRETEEIGVNSYYRYVTENNTIVHGSRFNWFFFHKFEHAMNFMRLIPPRLWMGPSIRQELDKTFSISTGYQNWETKIQINPDFVAELNKYVDKAEKSTIDTINATVF